jgi:hypothetical protein
MKPSFIIVLLLGAASLSTASMLFLDSAQPSSSTRVAAPPQITINWGEGSEAGVPDAALQNSLNEDTFVFAGKCANGETYRLFSYRKPAQGALMSYYDYAGPAGRGTVQSNTSPKVMAVRVCHPLAEIINANYWE